MLCFPHYTGKFRTCISPIGTVNPVAARYSFTPFGGGGGGGWWERTTDERQLEQKRFCLYRREYGDKNYIHSSTLSHMPNGPVSICAPACNCLLMPSLTIALSISLPLSLLLGFHSPTDTLCKLTLYIIPIMQWNQIYVDHIHGTTILYCLQMVYDDMGWYSVSDIAHSRAIWPFHSFALCLYVYSFFLFYSQLHLVGHIDHSVLCAVSTTEI